MDYFEFILGIFIGFAMSLLLISCRMHFSCAAFYRVRKGFTFMGTYAWDVVSGILYFAIRA